MLPVMAGKDVKRTQRAQDDGMRASPDSPVLSEYTVGCVKRIDLSKLSEKTVFLSHIYKLDVDVNAFHKCEFVITTTVVCLECSMSNL